MSVDVAEDHDLSKKEPAVFAAIMAAVFLKESFGARRIVAASVLATGLVLMQAGAV